ncbi:hypothetical protein LCGC14_0612010 [marine sediment metagenome]|uniref:N-acetyltransferase domain-containing protein n=1 Tax=marine sediment metagenome TaxID=412755 RepID=A0A0F9RRQ0_9ZZZZ
MRLVDIYKSPDSVDVLYRLLEERPKSANISHKLMPSRKKHKGFVESCPYTAWYLVLVTYGQRVGAIYLTREDEIGVSIFKDHERCGYATTAIRMLMGLHPRKRFLANINPENEGSIAMFEKLGFSHIQNTYALDV